MPEQTYPGFFTKTSLIQLCYGVWVNCTTMAIGLAYGFPAIQIPQLHDPSSEISVTNVEISWIAIIFSLFCPVGCIVSGILSDKYGRKDIIRWCNFPMFLGWVYTAVSRSGLNMIIARSLLGFGCGKAMGTARLFTSEISLPNMRGLLGATPNIFLALGITLQAALGLYFPWKNLCCICAGFVFILYFSYCFLTETPYYMLLKDSPTLAVKALAAFRACDYDLDAEIDNLIEFKRENNIRSLNCEEKFEAIFSGSACKPFGITLTFAAFGCISGVPVVTFWTTELLLAANSSLDVYEGNFYVAFTRLIFSGVASVLLFKTPRKVMALVGVGGVCVTWLLLGLILRQNIGPSAYPQIFLIVFTAFSSISYYILPFLLMSELYPLQIRGTLIGISISLTNGGMFLSAKCFPILRDKIGIAIVVFSFSISALCCFLFILAYLPETKDLTLREIEEHFKNQRTTPVAERQLSKRHQFGNGRKGKRLSDMVENSGHVGRQKPADDNESIAPASITSQQSKKSATLLTRQTFKSDESARVEQGNTSKNNEPTTSKEAEQKEKEDDNKK